MKRRRPQQTSEIERYAIPQSKLGRVGDRAARCTPEQQAELLAIGGGVSALLARALQLCSLPGNLRDEHSMIAAALILMRSFHGEVRTQTGAVEALEVSRRILDAAKVRNDLPGRPGAN